MLAVESEKPVAVCDGDDNAVHPICTECFSVIGDHNRMPASRKGKSGRCLDCQRKHDVIRMTASRAKPQVRENARKGDRRRDKECRHRRMMGRLSSRLRTSFKTSPKYRESNLSPCMAHKKEWLGTDMKSFVRYLESQFQPGMTWDNRREWEIDHILPLADFDLRDPEQRRVALHYTNQRPMWKKDHLQKTLQEGLADLKRRFGPKEEAE